MNRVKPERTSTYTYDLTVSEPGYTRINATEHTIGHVHDTTTNQRTHTYTPEDDTIHLRNTLPQATIWRTTTKKNKKWM